jgi:hypothetical protein
MLPYHLKMTKKAQTEHHIDSAWCVRMYYKDTVTMKTCFQMLKTRFQHLKIHLKTLDEEGIVQCNDVYLAPFLINVTAESVCGRVNVILSRCHIN